MKWIPITAGRLAVLAVGAMAAQGCDGAGGPAGFGDATRVTVLLTDAPGDVVNAWVDIGEIYLQGNREDEDAGGRVTLLTGPTGPLDLLELIDDPVELNTVVIPTGHYGQLRIVLEGAAVALENGDVYATDGFDPPGAATTGELICPGCGTSGFKVLLQGRELDLLDDEEMLVLDFDAGDSFLHEAGMSGRWIVTPVIKLFDDPGDGGD